ncbi:MAG: Gfo/Idh/MocA family protein [Candidatus Kryptoniota bacterium]
MSPSKVNIALVGVANHGETILNAIISDSRFLLRSCYDVNDAAADSVAKRLGCVRASSFEEIIDDPDVDAVALVTPNFVHRSQAVQALEAGKHVFVEKPLATNVREGKEIVEAARAHGRVLQVGHNTRLRRVFREAKKLLDTGAIGDVVNVYANMSFDFGLTKSVPDWKKQRDKCPLLPMTQLGIHFVDTLQYLIGRISRVSCFERSVLMRNNEGNAVTDTVVAGLFFDNGAVGSIQSSYVSCDVYSITIYGTRLNMTCYIDSIKLWKSSEFAQSAQTLNLPESVDAESYRREMSEFAECVILNRSPEVNGNVGLLNLAVIEAMARSSEGGKAISVSEVLQG